MTMSWWNLSVIKSITEQRDDQNPNLQSIFFVGHQWCWSSKAICLTLVKWLFNVSSLCFVWFWHLLWFFCLPSFRICTDDTKCCKDGIHLLLLCEIGALQLIIFQVEGFHEVRICSLQFVSGRFLLVVGRSTSFLAHVRSFHVVSCSC